MHSTWMEIDVLLQIPHSIIYKSIHNQSHLFCPPISTPRSIHPHPLYSCTPFSLCRFFNPEQLLQFVHPTQSTQSLQLPHSSASPRPLNPPPEHSLLTILTPHTIIAILAPRAILTIVAAARHQPKRTRRATDARTTNNPCSSCNYCCALPSWRKEIASWRRSSCPCLRCRRCSTSSTVWKCKARNSSDTGRAGRGWCVDECLHGGVAACMHAGSRRHTRGWVDMIRLHSEMSGWIPAPIYAEDAR